MTNLNFSKKRKTKIVGTRKTALTRCFKWVPISYVLEEINYVYSCKSKFHFGVMRGVHCTDMLTYFDVIHLATCCHKNQLHNFAVRGYLLITFFSGI